MLKLIMRMTIFLFLLPSYVFSADINQSKIENSKMGCMSCHQPEFISSDTSTDNDTSQQEDSAQDIKK